jgi:hypothetical protein
VRNLQWCHHDTPLTWHLKLGISTAASCAAVRSFQRVVLSVQAPAGWRSQAGASYQDPQMSNQQQPMRYIHMPKAGPREQRVSQTVQDSADNQDRPQLVPASRATPAGPDRGSHCVLMRHSCMPSHSSSQKGRCNCSEMSWLCMLCGSRPDVCDSQCTWYSQVSADTQRP